MAMSDSAVPWFDSGAHRRLHRVGRRSCCQLRAYAGSPIDDLCLLRLPVGLFLEAADRPETRQRRRDVLSHVGHRLEVRGKPARHRSSHLGLDHDGDEGEPLAAPLAGRVIKPEPALLLLVFVLLLAAVVRQ